MKTSLGQTLVEWWFVFGYLIVFCIKHHMLSLSQVLLYCASFPFLGQWGLGRPGVFRGPECSP